MGTNIHLRFPAGISTEPVVCNLTRLFDLDFNITTAQISERREGFLILELLGSPENRRRAVAGQEPGAESVIFHGGMGADKMLARSRFSGHKYPLRRSCLKRPDV